MILYYKTQMLINSFKENRMIFAIGSPKSVPAPLPDSAEQAETQSSSPEAKVSKQVNETKKKGNVVITKAEQQLLRQMDADTNSMKGSGEASTADVLHPKTQPTADIGTITYADVGGIHHSEVPKRKTSHLSEKQASKLTAQLGPRQSDIDGLDQLGKKNDSAVSALGENNMPMPPIKTGDITANLDSVVPSDTESEKDSVIAAVSQSGNEKVDYNNSDANTERVAKTIKKAKENQVSDSSDDALTSRK